MSPRNLLLIVIAVIFAAGTAMFVRGAQTPQVEVAEEVKPDAPRILVARKDIGAGRFVKADDDLEWAAWPSGSVQDYHIKEGSEELKNYQGAVARRALSVGEAITAQTLVKPGAGGFLSAVLEPGKRAVSIAVSATSGTSGFIFPGDRVDLMITHRMKMQETPQSLEEESVVSETFIENVRVVAVDQLLDNPDNKALLAKTVTVEVSPEQAEKVSVAEDMGKISFALRSLAADNAVMTESAGDPKAVGGPLEPVEGSQDFVSAITEPAQLAKPVKTYTRDRDISPSLGRHGTGSARVRVIRGDVSEQREFFQEAR